MATASPVVADAMSFDEFVTAHAGQHVCLIDGVVLPMSPAGQQHVDCVQFLADWLRSVRLGAPHHVREEKPLYTVGSDPEPDLAVMPGSRASVRGRRADARDAVLIVEVSESSLRFDRQSKLPLYARAAVPQVWIVDIAGRCVEVYRRPDDASHAYLEQVTLRGQERLLPPGYAGEGVTVAQVFAA